VHRSPTAARRARVPCDVDLEATHEHFHAHVDLGAVEVSEGDSVLLAEAPTHIEFGEVRRYRSSALVERAGPLRRAWTRLVGRFGFQDLYDVGFEG
jgi:hypothetical protein